MFTLSLLIFEQYFKYCAILGISVVDVTNLEQKFQEKITLNSLQYTAVQINFEFKVAAMFLVFGRYFINISPQKNGLFCKVLVNC